MRVDGKPLGGIARATASPRPGMQRSARHLPVGHADDRSHPRRPPSSGPPARASPSASSTPASTPRTRTSPRTSAGRCPATSRWTSRRSTGRARSATCIDPADVDDGGHGTHVAGTIAAARTASASPASLPDATIVNVRAGQDSGYFFLYETVAALTYAGDAELDVVNMSFYTDPWLYNCESADDYVSGDVTDEQIAEQAFIRSTLLAAVDYAHDHGVTLVAAAGNGVTDYWRCRQRSDATSPDYPAGRGHAAGRHQQLPRPARRGAGRDHRERGRTVGHEVRLLELRPRQHRRRGPGRLVPRLRRHAARSGRRGT